jgi:putative ABC transport system substrate-binding protein
MRPRAVVLIVSGAALFALAVGAPAQQPGKVWRVGALVHRQRPERLDSFPLGNLPQFLSDLGYVESRNVAFEWRFAGGDYARLPAMAAELVSLPVDVIVTDGTPGIRAAQGATKTIPIVFTGGGDLVADGLVKSLSKPGGNTTGFSLLLSDTAPKQLEILLAAAPGVSRLAVLFNSANPTGPSLAKSVSDAAERRNVRAVTYGAKTAEEIESAISRAAAARSQALIWIVDSFFFQQERTIAELAGRARMPSLSGYPEYAEDGGLMGYGPDRKALVRNLAGYVDRIFKGANPGELPVQQPSKLDLVINRKTAKALGLTLPPELLVQADRVIE